ncbi:MAG: bifunctional alpha/beta hydrolase/OsmC family protein [Neomegalonema sp.]|nr:bifunctional alpha/beta hydrolase/OsmC family protein [Neomegalonema sp.]
MRTERILFDGHAGDKLAARLDLPEFETRAYALFAHCFTCGKDIAAARRVAQRLTEQGVAVLRFDFTGLGHSKGEFANTSFTSNVDDLVQAAAWLAAERAAPKLIIGHSLGGAAAIAAAARLPEVRAVATIGAPADPGHVLHNFGGDLAKIRADGEADVELAGRRFRIGRGFVEDVEAASLDQILATLKRPLLVMHAPRDEFVGIDNASHIFAAAKHPKSFVSLDNADHLLTREEDAAYAADVIAAWAGRYALPTSSLEAGAADASLVRSAEVDPARFLQSIYAGGRHFHADEPKSVGGEGLGPTPYDLVAAGLAACTSMTVRMYARRKGLKLDRVYVDVSHQKIHASDCADCEAAHGRVDEFSRTVYLEGELSETERAKLMEIADKCPVHRTLEGEIKVRTVMGS